MVPPTLSPHAAIPAAPPGTPYTPALLSGEVDTRRANVSSLGGGFPSLPHSYSPTASPHTGTDVSYKLPHRPSSPLLNTSSISPYASPFSNKASFVGTPIIPPPLSPSTNLNLPFLNDPHYNNLLNQAQSQALQHEQARIASLTAHEASYTTINEYKHALARERRHSSHLTAELTSYKFLSKYQSCLLYSEAEISEEARINNLIKNIDHLKRDMNEDKCRVVMELEREEERIINGLMGRLEEVNREKKLLESQIHGRVGGSGMGDGMTNDQRVHARAQQMMAAAATNRRQQPTGGVEESKATNDAMQESKTQQEDTKEECGIADGEGCEEQEDEEMDEDNDILEGMHHDPEMEKELENLLSLKDGNK